MRFAWLLSILFLAAPVCASDDLKQAARMASFEEKADASLQELVKEVSSKTPATMWEELVHLSIYMRAGMEKEAVETLLDLKKFYPAYENAPEIYDAAARRNEWMVAQRTLEIFSDNLSSYDGSNSCRSLIRHFEKTGWSFEKIDQWLASLSKDKSDVWSRARYEYALENNHGDTLFNERFVYAKDHPEDVKGVISYLDALLTYQRGKPRPKFTNGSFSWLTKNTQPERPLEMAEIAKRVIQLEDYETSAFFYHLILSTPLAPEEERESWRRYPTTVEGTNDFQMVMQRGLLTSLVKLNQLDEAKMMIKTLPEPQRGKAEFLRMFPMLQDNPPANKESEKKEIPKKPSVSETDPQSWGALASYWHDKKDAIQEENARKKALEICRQQFASNPEGRNEMCSYLYGHHLSEYALFLLKENRAEEARVLLREALRISPLDSNSSSTPVSSISMLVYDHADIIDPDEIDLWKWLDNREKWDLSESGFLWGIFKTAPKSKLTDYIDRAEKLTLEKDPSRALMLAQVLSRKDCVDGNYRLRAIPLFRYAIEKTEDSDRKKIMCTYLFQLYLELGDWKHAEVYYPQCDQNSGPGADLDWLGRVAILAAQDGAKEDAIRIWRKIAKKDLTVTFPLNQLVKFGLKDELIQFYQEMQKVFPTSTVPERELKELAVK